MFYSRREMLAKAGAGFGTLGLAAMLGSEAKAGPTVSANPLAPRQSHFAGKAKRVIFLFMNGGPSHVDTFDPKPKLVDNEGKPGPGGKFMPSPFKFAKHGHSGLEISDIYPQLSKCADDLCVVRSMHTPTPNHEPGL